MSKNVAVLLALLFLIAIGVPNLQPIKAESREFTVTNVNQLLEAMNEAANGDVIIVKSGTYEAPQDRTLMITKSISLVGEDATNTMINLHPGWGFQRWGHVSPIYGFSDALDIKASDVEISGLTISSDGGSFIATGSRIQIKNSNIATPLLVSGSYQNVSQSTITGGIRCWGSFNTIAENRILSGEFFVAGFANRIYDNVVADGEGITLVDYDYEGTYPSYKENILFNNTVKNCSSGLLVQLGIVHNNYSSQNIVYHNNFIGNDQQVNFYQYNPSWIIEYNGFLDNGREGNYWSDYAGNDENGDGIGDSHYIINANNTDRYPLMYPWGEPDVTVYILENATYGNLPVTFTANKPTSWTGYSLDGLDNVTISGNTTLTRISSGFHNITVYALDAYGVSGVSETFHFSIAEVPEPFPTALIIVASVATVAVVGVGLFAYRRRRRREALQQ